MSSFGMQIPLWKNEAEINWWAQNEPSLREKWLSVVVASIPTNGRQRRHSHSSHTGVCGGYCFVCFQAKLCESKISAFHQTRTPLVGAAEGPTAAQQLPYGGSHKVSGSLALDVKETLKPLYHWFHRKNASQGTGWPPMYCTKPTNIV